MKYSIICNYIIKKFNFTVTAKITMKDMNKLTFLYPLTIVTDKDKGVETN